ncbi:hypothetical protein SteCoe_11746 [Stentor coeruleus]|uniref:Uncharacterized protein n=1 Tax=Stentor coeruleus TaxID=5963 RepID=A0A1R2CCF5_9CILI|nr:hypothetical protein SteCoe_11746 [Stentor coeruleus]
MYHDQKFSGPPNLPSGFPGLPMGMESIPGMSMPLIPPHLLLAMQSNLPPEKVREMLTEQAEMLDQMATKMKSSKEDDMDSYKGNVSRRVNELERELFIEKKSSSDRKETREDFQTQRDIEMLKQELASIKLREESTYLDLQKSHHQIHLLESQLLELQRKHFSELEHLNFDNAELRRRLEAAEYRNSSLQKENEYLRNQAFQLKKQIETNEEADIKKPLKNTEDYNESSYRREYSPDETEISRKDRNKRLSAGEIIMNKGKIVSNNEGYQRDFSPEDRRRRNEFGGENDLRNEEQWGRKKDYMPVRTIINTSNNVTEALNWKTGPSRNDPNPNILVNLQSKLSSLTQEKYKLENELEKLAESRNPSAVKRKNDLELELSICQSNINSVTAKIRKI